MDGSSAAQQAQGGAGCVPQSPGWGLHGPQGSGERNPRDEQSMAFFPTTEQSHDSGAVHTPCHILWAVLSDFDRATLWMPNATWELGRSGASLYDPLNVPLRVLRMTLYDWP